MHVVRTSDDFEFVDRYPVTLESPVSTHIITAYQQAANGNFIRGRYRAPCLHFSSINAKEKYQCQPVYKILSLNRL